MATSAPAPSHAAISPSTDTATPTETPGIARRLACFTYEGVLLFGVTASGGLVFLPLTQQKNGPVWFHGWYLFLFLLVAIYFIWFWSRSGQTVAMLAWHIRLLDMNNRPPTQLRAAARYLLSWIWFAPACLFAWLAKTSLLHTFGLLFIGVVTYALLSRLHPRKQYWHDVVCGTQLVTHRPPPKKKPQ
jgi:uncharacterized RDD family membrane protein YckC